MNKRRRIVAICGRSGSGKSFIVKRFTNYAKVGTDDFYIGKSNMEPDENGVYNFDNPNTVDLEECAKAVIQLAESPTGTKVTIPKYDMKISEPSGTRTIITPSEDGIVVVEGIFSFHPPLLDLATLRIFMDPPPEVILARRYRRDIEERGRTPKSILKQYPSVIEGYETYIRPMRKFADLVIDFGCLI